MIAVQPSWAAIFQKSGWGMVVIPWISLYSSYPILYSNGKFNRTAVRQICLLTSLQCRSVRWQNYWLRFLQKINKGRTHEKEKKKQPFRQKRSCRQKQPFRQKQNRIRTSRAGKDLNLVYLPCIIRKNGSTTKKECRICGNAGKWFRKVHRWHWMTIQLR